MNDIYAYQKEFVDRAIDLLDSKGKAAVVLPTGVGKSYIAADVIRHYLRENECVIWCINHLIICETQKEKFIASSYKDVVPYISPLTYTSAGKYKGKRPFLIVIDEFQYVGAIKWRQNIQKLLDMFPDVPVLGLSATPFRPSDRIKKGEIYVARNMGDEFFEGNYAVEMYYSEVWARTDIALEPPTYVTAAYFEDMFDQTEKKLNELPKDVRKTLMKKEYKAMKQNLQLAHGVDKVLKKYLRNDGHYIFFCRNLTHLHKMKRQVARWLKDSFDDYELFEVSYKSENPYAILKRFSERSGKLKIIFSVDMLGVGIHIKCDGVILARPTQSINVEIQQIGRASAVGKRAIIIDLVNNLTYFNKLKEETEACKGLSSGKCSNDVLPADFSIIDETVSYLDVLDNFNRKLDILKGNVVPEEKINMIVDAHLNKHAPMDFCLKQLNMSEADFVKIVEQYKEEERVS